MYRCALGVERRVTFRLEVAESVFFFVKFFDSRGACRFTNVSNGTAKTLIPPITPPKHGRCCADRDPALGFGLGTVSTVRPWTLHRVGSNERDLRG